MNILLVEDDPKVAGSVRQGLKEAQEEVTLARSVREALDRIPREAVDLILLDLGLPDGDGLEVLRAARRAGKRIPVLILTARDSVEDKVTGLDVGADDYLVKPFAFSELLARIHAICRRTRDESKLLLRVADLEIDLVKRAVTRAGRYVDLSTREFDLLACLARSAGHPISRDTLIREVWRITSRATPMDNLIDVYISHLRNKIDREFEVKLVRTIRGVGFSLGPGA